MPIRTVEVPGDFPAKWDLADPVPEGADLSGLLQAAKYGVATRLRPFITSAAAFVLKAIPEREQVVEPFLPTSSLSMIYAARGVGKTWFALSLCVAVSRGDDFLTFAVPVPRTVLFVDGEMALADLQQRVRALDPQPAETLYLLPSESLFREDRPLNINMHEDQAAIEAVIEEMRLEGHRPEVLVFDNLSSLSGGIDENDNSALDALLQWLVRLRHKGLAVVLVHHAGKSGDQRGASRREDMLDTSIKLSRPKPSKEDDDGPPPEGAHFDVEFVKVRGKAPRPSEFSLELEETADGRVRWLSTEGEAATASEKTLRSIALTTPATQAALAETRRLTKGAISQHCKALRKSGYIDNGLSLTEEGRRRVIELWSDLSGRLAIQDDLPI